MLNVVLLSVFFLECHYTKWQCLTNIDIESQNRFLKVCYVPTTSAGLPRQLLLLLFFAAVINSTNEANKAVDMYL